MALTTAYIHQCVYTIGCLLCLQEAEQLLAGVGELGMDTLHDALTKFNVLAPDTKNPISKPFPFNLMFKTSIGPKGDMVGYLRPETAQVRGQQQLGSNRFSSRANTWSVEPQ